ncbi:MAG: DISARM system helicase DrmA, partial [Solirubrobacteraceae bacterium]
VRDRLVEALELDLVGPGTGHPLAEERLPGWERPSNWYLTGFLIPVRSVDDEAGDVDSDEEVDEPQEDDPSDDGAEDRTAAKRRYFPSSLGLSTLVAAGVAVIRVTVQWGDYTVGEQAAGEAGESDGESRSRPRRVWQRTPQKRTIEVPLSGSSSIPRVIPVPDSNGLELHILERPLPAAGIDGRIPADTRAVSVFLVNDRDPDSKQRDRAYIFQAGLEVGCEKPFVPRPDLRSGDSDWDEQVADLHYADTPEFATGHGVSVDWDLVGGECRLLRTRWIPSAEVEQTIPADAGGAELRMEALGALVDGAAAQAALAPLVSEYRAWIELGESETQVLDGERRSTAGTLLSAAWFAAGRIERGIATLAGDPDALDAFRMANRAVAKALRRRLHEVNEPAWRPFQLAFLLINLPGLADPAAPDRSIVDLLYFPTGGGKTEAYLALAAFAIVLRRLRRTDPGRLTGAGVTVVMRYTLRLLTLDQLSRAAGLICALELERQYDQDRYGTWPFEIGLWVGKAATPNGMGHKGDGRTDRARSRVLQYKANPQGKPSPIPLEECPWCQTPFTAASFSLHPDSDRPRELRIVCTNFECDFTRDRPLPIVTVDEPLYRRLPAFLIATVDKFAALPWVGPSGALLGGASRYDATGFYGAAEPGRGTPLPEPLPPPDLVIQDELHLISGPLGTMAGLYETAIAGLCQRELDNQIVAPKIIASTATVRRAQDQIQALFARATTQIFPPPGPDRRESFFARTVPASNAPACRYIGVAAPGRNPKVVMRKVWLALMGAAERCYRDNGGHNNAQNPVDGYMTVIGYFNSLRELGGARRIIEEEVRNTVGGYGARRRIGEHPGLFQDRRNFNEVVELTSRVPTNKVAEARRRLGTPFTDIKQRVDCALATNMISVGLDIPRLGLMGVLGQPKAAAEYIQATSRVGRTNDAPGLVVTLLNVHKPRDRSHYERFRHFHETFYRSVEVGSVT